MHARDIFSTVPKEDHLGLIQNLANVQNFLNLDKADLSKAANIAKSSVRFDERMPQDLKDLLYEIAIVCELVAEHFNGDAEKTALWFKMKNPSLGGLSPRDMIRFGRFQKLKKVVQQRLEGNVP